MCKGGKVTKRLWKKISQSTVSISFYLKISGKGSLPRSLGKEAGVFYGALAGEDWL